MVAFLDFFQSVNLDVELRIKDKDLSKDTIPPVLSDQELSDLFDELYDLHKNFERRFRWFIRATSDDSVGAQEIPMTSFTPCLCK